MQVKHPLPLFALSMLLIGAILVAIPGIGAAAAVLPYTTQAQATDDQVGTDSNDLSGVTYNQARDRVLAIDNGSNRIHEYETDGSGALIIGPRRTLQVTFGAGDLEGIAWVADDDYAILSENSGTIELITIPNDIGVTSIDSSSQTIDTTIPEADGATGAEGIAVDYNETDSTIIFWVSREKEPAVFKIDSANNVLAIIPVPVLDASGVYASAVDDTIFVVSDESQQVVQLEIDADLGTATLVSSMDLPDFEQAEGITFSTDMSSMYIFGESPTDGLTFARYQGPSQAAVPEPEEPEPTPAGEPTPAAPAPASGVDTVGIGGVNSSGLSAVAGTAETGVAGTRKTSASTTTIGIALMVIGGAVLLTGRRSKL